METKPQKLFTTTQNFALIKESVGEYKSNTPQVEMIEFLNYWQNVYDIWSCNNPPTDLTYIEEKIKIRKSLILKFGFRD